MPSKLLIEQRLLNVACCLELEEGKGKESKVSTDWGLRPSSFV